MGLFSRLVKSPLFTDEKSEAQRGIIICLESFKLAVRNIFSIGSIETFLFEVIPDIYK